MRGCHIAKAGGNANALKQALGQAVDRLPKVEGTPGEVHISRELTTLLNAGVPLDRALSITSELTERAGFRYLAMGR